MPPKKESTGEQAADKGDFMDFIKDASKKPSLASDFLKHVRKPDANAADLCQLFHSCHYDSVRIKDCTTLLDAAKDPSLWASEFQKRY
jgi:hypothetical protein